MDRTTLITFLERPEFLVGALTGFILALLLLLLIKGLRRSPEMFEAFTNDAGKVLISRHALQEQIQRCCEELDDIGKARARVISNRDVLSVRVHLRVKSNAKLVGISGYLQEQIDTVVRKNLGVENIGPIDIVVTGILPSAQEPATRIKPEEKTAE